MDTATMTEKEAFLYYMERMDIEMLDLILDDGITYYGVRKEVFLEKLGAAFVEFKKSNDSSLRTYKGKCGSDSCPNKGIKGCIFVGNSSRNHLELLIEESGTHIIDLSRCPSFEREKIDVELGKKISFYIDRKST